MSAEASSGSTGPALVELPESVRSRVVALTARVLPQVGSLPPGLKRVADFAPARRARLGASAITTALADDEVRERVGVQVAAGPAVDAADPAAVVAHAWLVRPEGWRAAVQDFRDVVPAREDDEVERLRTRLAVAEQAAREARAKVRVQLDELKADNTTLRRKLGQSRADERVAREEAERMRQVAADAVASVESATAAQDKELRRLRLRIEQLEAEASSRRRSERSDRDDLTLRTRVLLETVIDAATGLRRELGLPQVAGTPADRVEAAIAAAGGGASTTPPGGSGPGSAALLEQLLGMPRSRLIIDGYNVSKTAWPESSLEAQRVRLLTTLAPLVARTGAETTVVFDAATATTRPVVRTPRGVKVLFSPAGVIADDVIRELVDAEPPGRVVVVITGDQAIVRDVGAVGARAMAAETLLAATS